MPVPQPPSQAGEQTGNSDSADTSENADEQGLPLEDKVRLAREKIERKRKEKEETEKAEQLEKVCAFK